MIGIYPPLKWFSPPKRKFWYIFRISFLFEVVTQFDIRQLERSSKTRYCPEVHITQCPGFTLVNVMKRIETCIWKRTTLIPSEMTLNRITLGTVAKDMLFDRTVPYDRTTRWQDWLVSSSNCGTTFLLIPMFWPCLCMYLIYLAAHLRFLHHIRSALQYSLVQGLSVFHSFMRGSHLLPDQLPGEHTGDMAAFSTLLLQCDNLGKYTMFLHLPYCTFLQSYNQAEVWWLGTFQQSTHILLCAPIT